MLKSPILRFGLLAVAFLSLHAFASARMAPTKLLAFHPASMNVTGRISGNCWTASIAVNKSYAYRCMSGNEIHDPCFMLNAKSVACPLDPAHNSGVVMRLTKPLPKNPSSSMPVQPWVYVLASGGTCTIGTGTRNPDYPYYCTGELVCSAPAPTNVATGTYTVRCGKQVTQIAVRGLHTVPVTTIWR